MAVRTLRISNFSDGISDDDKIGQKHAASSAQSIDFRRSPAQAGLLREMEDESNGVIAKEIWDAVRTNDGSIYLAGINSFTSGGTLYKRTPAANGANGSYAAGNSFDARDLLYREDLDTIFPIGPTYIGEYGPLGGSPSVSTQKYSEYIMLSADNTGGAYPIPAAISESEKLEFTVTKEPLSRLIFRCVTKTGAPTFTITIHDASNKVVGTYTVVTGNIIAGSDFSVLLGSLRLKIGNTYHAHITSSVAANTIRSTAANTLTAATIDFAIFTARLVNTPITDPYGHIPYTSGAISYICNERYLAEWEILDTSTVSTRNGLMGNTSGYNPHRLIFPANFVTCGLGEYSEYLVIAAAIKEGSDTTDTRGSTGMLFFWDKVSDFYNFAIPVPQGVPESLYSYGNAIYFIAAGTLYRWAGNDIETVFQFPGVDEFGDTLADAPQIDNYLRAPRHGMTTWKGLLIVAFPRLTANTLIEYAVYSFGRAKSYLPEAMGQDYGMSTGSGKVNFNTATSPDTPITGYTFIKAFGTNLLAAWVDRIAGVTEYGVDLLNDKSAYTTDAVWRSLWFDNGDPNVIKTPFAVKVTFEPLAPGCEVTPTILYDRDYDNEIVGTDGDGNPVKAVAGDIDIVLHLDSVRGFYEAMFGFNITGSGTDDVRITSVSFEFDDNRQNTNATRERRATD